MHSGISVVYPKWQRIDRDTWKIIDNTSSPSSIDTHSTAHSAARPGSLPLLVYCLPRSNRVYHALPGDAVGAATFHNAVAVIRL